MSRIAGLLVVAIVGGVASWGVAACGGSDTGARTVTRTVLARPTVAPPSTAATSTAPPATATPTSTVNAPSALSLSDATRIVLRHGFSPALLTDYHLQQTLRVLVAARTGSADGRTQKAFFFVGNRFIGTDTADTSAAIRVVHQEDSVVTLGYALYNRNDPLCCPHGGQAVVPYRWNGSKLMPESPIPPSGDVDGSRG